MRSNKYDIVVVSPRNFFLYTPLLPAVATGTMEERSIVEPVRNLVLGKVRPLSPHLCAQLAREMGHSTQCQLPRASKAAGGPARLN